MITSVSRAYQAHGLCHEHQADAATSVPKQRVGRPRQARGERSVSGDGGPGITNEPRKRLPSRYHKSVNITHLGAVGAFFLLAKPLHRCRGTLCTRSSHQGARGRQKLSG